MQPFIEIVKALLFQLIFDQIIESGTTFGAHTRHLLGYGLYGFYRLVLIDNAYFFSQNYSVRFQAQRDFYPIPR